MVSANNNDQVLKQVGKIEIRLPEQEPIKKLKYRIWVKEEKIIDLDE